MARRIAFAVGDTTGHVMLPLATAEAYRRVVPGLDVLFLAGPGGPASQLVPAAGYRLAVVPASALARVGPVGKAAAVGRLVPGVIRARALLRAHGAQLVVGSGGYASGCVLLAARSLGLCTALIEPNAVPGLANQLLKHVVDRAYVTFEGAAAQFPVQARVITGTPIRRALVDRLLEVSRVPARDRPHRVLVASGSRGERFLAERVPLVLRALLEHGLALEVQHQAASPDTERVARIYETAGISAHVTPFFDDMADAYAWADFAVTRSGATTLAELALAGLPSLLVPLSDAAADHQAPNARAFAETGAALWVREAEWEESALANQLAAVLLNPDRWQLMADCARCAATPEAAESIARDCERVMEGRW